MANKQLIAIPIILLLLSFRNDAESIFGTWISEEPIELGGSAMAGFDILEPKNGFKKNEWNLEGIMYDHMSDGARTYPSSFDYQIDGNILKIKITFTAALLEVGDEFAFTLNLISENELEVTYSDQTAIYMRE